MAILFAYLAKEEMPTKRKPQATCALGEFKILNLKSSYLRLRGEFVLLNFFFQSSVNLVHMW
ncbi:MAG: hypothetical protein JWM20_290 [Patescibacteria group bacterium]|nr:hypothetical protein [Patescibacteria group bacterium]